VIHNAAGNKFDLKVVEALEAAVSAGKLRTAPALVEV
jgi:hypothetical protein